MGDVAFKLWLSEMFESNISGSSINGSQPILKVGITFETTVENGYSGKKNDLILLKNPPWFKGAFYPSGLSVFKI